MLTLALAAFVAGFIDSIAGGGGLITIPVLLLSGMPPAVALGTNKLQGLFGSGSAAIHYARKGHLNLAKQLPLASLSFISAVCGAWVATRISPDWLQRVMPFLLIAIALYFALKPSLGDEDKSARFTPAAFAATAIPLIAFYDGIFGPGTGSFFMIAFVVLAGYGVLKATAHTKFLNFASNLGGFCAFALAGVVDWRVGLVMGAAQVAGARIGASLAIANGARLIRPLLVITCLVLAARLFTA
ncbi:MAG: TSUP family transporter [Rhizobiaceae bacterium]